MTSGGGSDDRDWTPPRHSRRSGSDEWYDPDDSYPPRNVSRQDYPDSYIDEYTPPPAPRPRHSGPPPGSYDGQPPGSYSGPPAGTYGAGTYGGGPIHDPRDMPDDRDVHGPRDGRLHRIPPSSRSAPPPAGGFDVRSAGQAPIYGPDTRSTGAQPHIPGGYGQPNSGQQPRTDSVGGRPPTNQQPWPDAFGGSPHTAQQPRTAAFPQQPGARGGPHSGQQPRVYDPGQRMPANTGGRPRVPGQEQPRRRGRALTVVVVLVIVLAAVGIAGFVVLRHKSSADNASGGASPRPTFDTTAIASRTVDPAAMTAAEAFGAPISAAGGGSYRVVKSEADTTCGNAVTAQLGTLLTSLGCSQAVRATLLSSDQSYVITAGVLNMPDAAAAAKAAGSIKADIDGGKGRFNGLGAGGNTDIITVAQSRVAWDTRGHYLVYSMIALANGTSIGANDSRVPAIINDVVENYLGDKVLAARAHKSTSATPSHPAPSST